MWPPLEVDLLRGLLMLLGSESDLGSDPFDIPFPRRLPRSLALIAEILIRRCPPGGPLTVEPSLWPESWLRAAGVPGFLGTMKPGI